MVINLGCTKVGMMRGRRFTQWEIVKALWRQDGYEIQSALPLIY